MNGYTTQADTNRRIAAEREAKRKEREASDGSLNGSLPVCSTNDQPKLEVRSQKLEVKKPEAGNQKPERSKADARASRLPADWTPSQDDIEFCNTERPELDPRAVAAGFRDYWIGVPGAKGRKVDWPATWRNWVRNQKANGKGASSNAAAFEEAERLIFGDKKEDIPGESKRV